MTPRSNPWQSYRTVTAQTAPPEQLVLMLYDGAITYLEKGLTGFEFKDPRDFNETINNNVQRAQAIINEMNARLDLDRGGEVAVNFRRLYDYFHRRLQEGNFRKKKPPIEEVLKLLRELRETWAEMLHRGPAHAGEEAPPEDEALRFA